MVGIKNVFAGDGGDLELMFLVDEVGLDKVEALVEGGVFVEKFRHEIGVGVVIFKVSFNEG